MKLSFNLFGTDITLVDTTPPLTLEDIEAADKLANQIYEVDSDDFDTLVNDMHEHGYLPRFDRENGRIWYFVEEQ